MSPSTKRAGGAVKLSSTARVRFVVPAPVVTGWRPLRSPTQTTAKTLLSKRGGPSGEADTDGR